MSSPLFPEPPPSIPATSLPDCDAAVDKLYAARGRWVRTSIAERILLLKRCLDGMAEVCEAWVRDACRAKGHAPGSHGEGEEWLGGPMPTIRNLRMLVEALEAGGAPKPVSGRARPDGRYVAQVFPSNIFERIMFAGVTAEVWIEPGKPATQGRVYREHAAGRFGDGAVALVLAAGNQASIGPMDLLYKLFVDDEVVVLKMNPVNEYVGPHVARAFRALLERDLVHVVYGGAEVGQHLCRHEKVHSIHITGSEKTHDAIIWGPPEEHIERKRTGRRANEKPITSELGSVSPLIVVPGPWSDADLAFQARHTASMVAHNGSFNCNALKVLVLPKQWPLRERFLTAVRDTLTRTAPRKAYYPGAQQRYEGFLQHYPDAQKLGDRSAEVVPWTLITNVRPEKGEYALTNEAFCGVLAVTELDGADAPTFLANAVTFCNETVWGSLSCMMLVHPSTEKAHKREVDQAIGDLRFGGIGINCWSGLVYGLVGTTWGAHPGHTIEDVRSGIGVVHNTYLFDHPQKSIVRAPFRINPTPAWFADHKNLAKLGRLVAHFELAPGWGRLPAAAIAGLRG